MVAFSSWRVSGGTSFPQAQRLEQGGWQEAVGFNALGSISPPNCSNKEERRKKKKEEKNPPSYFIYIALKFPLYKRFAGANMSCLH